jgi:hypothetical protein
MKQVYQLKNGAMDTELPIFGRHQGDMLCTCLPVTDKWGCNGWLKGGFMGAHNQFLKCRNLFQHYVCIITFILKKMGYA